MTFSGSVHIGGPGGFSSRFEVSKGDSDFEFKIGRDREDDKAADAPKPAAARGGEADEARDARSDQFLDDVKSLKDSSSKRALIDNFVKDAIKGDKAEAGAQKADKPEGGQPAQAAAKKPDAKGDELGFKPVMKELQNLAKAVDTSKLPEGTQNKMLDGIAELASELKDVQAEGGDLRKSALLGMADLAQTLDGARGGEKAKGAIMDKIADSLAGIASGNLGEPAPSGAEAPPANGKAPPSDAGAAPKTGNQTTPASDDASKSTDSNGPWTHSVKDGKAEIQLGDKYTITAQEDGEAWTVKNNETGASTRISGDPHVDVGADGKNDWDFKKDMTFQLDDGTKVTVGTVPADNGTTYSSSLTITNGDKAMQVTGLAGGHDGKDNLKVVQSDEGGQAIDDFTLDGLTVEEQGSNWASANGGQTITQDLVNKAEAAV